MKKTNRFELRLSESDFELIKRVAVQKEMTVSHFILSVIIPLCCKIDSKNKGEEKC